MSNSITGNKDNKYQRAVEEAYKKLQNATKEADKLEEQGRKDLTGVQSTKDTSGNPVSPIHNKGLHNELKFRKTQGESKIQEAQFKKQKALNEFNMEMAKVRDLRDLRDPDKVA